MNYRLYRRKNPPHYATSVRLLKFLLNLGADPTLLCEGGFSPLTWHVQEGLEDFVDRQDLLGVVACMLQYPGVRATVDVQTHRGYTALHFACRQSADGTAISMVRLLLQAGANPKIANRQGHTPLDLTRRRTPYCHAAIARLFEETPETEKTSLLVKARRLVAVSRNHTAPAYLQNRVLQGLPLPRVVLTSAVEDEEERKFRTMVAFLLGWGRGPTVWACRGTCFG